MEFLEYLLVFLACFGLFALVFVLFGRLLFPVGSGGTKIFVVIKGSDCECVGRALRGVDWLRSAGILEAEVVILSDTPGCGDCGLGRTGAELVALEQLADHIGKP